MKQIKWPHKNRHDEGNTNHYTQHLPLNKLIVHKEGRATQLKLRCSGKPKSVVKLFGKKQRKGSWAGNSADDDEQATN